MTKQKEIRLRPSINEHDIKVKLKRARNFLEHGDRVLVTMNFRGREMVHLDRAKELIQRITDELEEVAKIEKAAKLEGRRMSTVFTPK